MPTFNRPALLAAIIAGLPLAAQAETVRVTFTNLSPEGGLTATPVFTGFHDGSFDLFDPPRTLNPAPYATRAGFFRLVAAQTARRRGPRHKLAALCRNQAY